MFIEYEFLSEICRGVFSSNCLLFKYGILGVPILKLHFATKSWSYFKLNKQIGLVNLNCIYNVNIMYFIILRSCCA